MKTKKFEVEIKMRDKDMLSSAYLHVLIEDALVETVYKDLTVTVKEITE